MNDAQLRELGLPDIFIAIGRGTAPSDVQASCLPTARFLEMQPGLAETFPPIASYVPLWMLPSFGVVAFDSRRGVYVRHYIGDRTDTVVARDYQELCAFLFLELMETGLWDELGELAPPFRFEHLDELKTFVENESPGPSHQMAQKFMDGLRR